jgi:preprotein translocase SecE subunit
VAEDTGKPKRRLIKKAETVREKTEKAALEGSKQPRRLQATGRRAAAPFRAAGKASSKLGRFKVLRIIGLILVPPYFRNSWKELRQVTWTKRKDSFRLTGAVIVFAIVFGLVVFVLDFILDKVFKEVLLK